MGLRRSTTARLVEPKNFVQNFCWKMPGKETTGKTENDTDFRRASLRALEAGGNGSRLLWYCRRCIIKTSASNTKEITFILLQISLRRSENYWKYTEGSLCATGNSGRTYRFALSLTILVQITKATSCILWYSRTQWRTGAHTYTHTQNEECKQ